MSDATYEGRMPVIDDFCDPEPAEQKEMFPGFPCFLFTPEDFKKSKKHASLLCKCACCGKQFKRSWHELKRKIVQGKKEQYCSLSCSAKKTLPEPSPSYHCEVCGKFVPEGQKYGTGRFCSKTCSNRYSSTCKNREEINKRVSIKLKAYYETHPSPSLLPGHLKEKENINLAYTTIKSFIEHWNLADILQMKFSDPYYRKYALKAIKKYHLIDDPKFFPSRWPLFVEMCRHILQKPIEEGSLTYEDIDKISNYFNKCIWENKMTCNEIIRMHIQCDKRSLHLKENLPNVKFRTTGEDFSIINERLRKDDWTSYVEHPIPKRKYDKLCAFRFKEDLYPLIKGYDLYCQFGMYSVRTKSTNGVEKDHRISKAYGWKHNIDPAIISHPANCEFLPYDENRRKLEKCSITLEQLMEEIKAFDERIYWWTRSDLN